MTKVISTQTREVKIGDIALTIKIVEGQIERIDFYKSGYFLLIDSEEWHSFLELVEIAKREISEIITGIKQS